MKKVITIFTFFVLIISIFFIKMQAASYSPEKVLVKAFESSGAATVGSELYVRGKLEDGGRMNIDGKKQLIEDVLKSLDADMAKPEYRTIDTGVKKGIESDCSLPGGGRLHAGIIDERDDGFEGSYVSISLVDPSGYGGLPEKRAVLEKVLNSHGVKPEFSSCITGCYEGKSGNKELNAVCARIFASADARKVEGIREGGLISVSAFSNAIRESVNDNGYRVNLNLAVRYNSYEKKTYIWLATPVITTEY